MRPLTRRCQKDEITANFGAPTTTNEHERASSSSYSRVGSRVICRRSGSLTCGVTS